MQTEILRPLVTARLISIVVPIHNEKENILPFFDEIAQTIPHLNFEVIFSNDGSYDGSTEILDQLAARDSRVRVIHFRRNFGQTAAMSAGFKNARGEIVIAMDGDMQNDPRDIPVLVSKIEEGYDLVSGWRKNRQDKAVSRRLPSMIANRLIGWTTDVKIHDYGCTLKAYRSTMLKHVDLYGEMHRFIPALAKTVGARITEVVVNHRSRTRGTTKYGISRTFRVILDLMTVRFLMRFQSRPLHMIGIPGLISCMVGTFILIYLAALKLVWGEAIGQRPLLVIGVLMIMAGIQFFGLGLLGEFLTRIYFSVSGREPYIIDRIEERPNVKPV